MKLIYEDKEYSYLELIESIQGLEYLLISNSITDAKTLPPVIRQLNVAPLLAEAIRRIYEEKSVSSLFD